MKIAPTPPQHKFIQSEKTFPAFVGGYGSGKTEALINRAILQKLKYPTLDRAFYEPTYDLIRMIAFPRWEEKLTELGLPYRLVKSPQNTIEIEGRGCIYFRSMDVAHRIIGYEVADSDVDELDTLKPDDAAEVWRRIIARNRQNKPDGAKNTVAVATTPEGFRFVYQRWEKEKHDDYEIIRAPTYSNTHLPPGYIETLRADYPPQLIDAYIEGHFVNLTTGTVYHAYDAELNGSKETVQDGEALHIGMDFNVGFMAGIVHVLREGNPHAVDEIMKGYDTPDMVRMIKERYWTHDGNDYRKTREIYVYPDSSGGSRKSVDAQRTDISTLEQAGFKVIAPKKNPPVKDRVNSMNAMFCNDKGERRYFVNRDLCVEYSDCLIQQAWDDKGDPDKSSGLDHPVDAAGYFINVRYPISKPAAQVNIRLPV
jgi:phage terminase large subunit